MIVLKKLRVSTVLAGIFGIVFIISSCMVFQIVSEARREKRAFADLAEMVNTADTQSEDIETDESSSPYAALKEQNSDFFGWISIEGTTLNYPVMYTPDDPEYYLRRDFNGKKSQSGVPFLAGSCYEGCENYLIYGHNMKNGAMFATLMSYADQEYWEQHPTIQFDTLTESGEYDVLAAFYSEIYAQDANDVFRYYQYTDLSDPSVFAEYVEQAQSAALYDTGISAAYGDQLLTLSTCSYHTDNGRFVIVARKK